MNTALLRQFSHTDNRQKSDEETGSMDKQGNRLLLEKDNKRTLLQLQA